MLSVNSTQLTSAECACRSELCGVCEFSSRFDDMRIRDLCGMKVINMYRKSMGDIAYGFFMNTRSRLESQVCCDTIYPR